MFWHETYCTLQILHRKSQILYDSSSVLNLIHESDLFTMQLCILILVSFYSLGMDPSFTKPDQNGPS